MEKNLYIGLIEEHGSNESFFQLYWSRASDPGQAIQSMIDFAKVNGLKKPIPNAFSEYDINNLEIEVTPDPASDVFCSISRFFYPSDDNTFQLPLGVIFDFSDDEEDRQEIARGYTLKYRDNGLVCVEVNVESGNLLFLYGELLKLNSNYDAFWYVLHDDKGDNAADQFLATEQFNTPFEIIEHLINYQLDSINNGLVTLTAYFEEGATNLSISDHKRIIIIAYSKDVIDRCIKVLESHEHPRKENLLVIDSLPHWHYRLPGSRGKDELVASLIELGFEDWVPEKTED